MNPSSRLARISTALVVDLAVGANANSAPAHITCGRRKANTDFASNVLVFVENRLVTKKVLYVILICIVRLQCAVGAQPTSNVIQYPYNGQLCSEARRGKNPRGSRMKKPFNASLTDY